MSKKEMNGTVIRNDISFTIETFYTNDMFFQFDYIKSLSHYDDWLKLSDYDRSEMDLVIVKKPESDNIKITFSTNPLNQWTFISSLEYFSNAINDYGKGYSLNILYDPTDWLFIDVAYQLDSYYDKYHFLKIKPYTNIIHRVIPISTETILSIQFIL